MMKTIVSLLILLTLFAINTLAANVPPRQKTILKLDRSADIRSITFSPDSQSVASGSWQKHVNLWDLTSEEPQPLTIEADTDSHIHSVAFSPDGSTLAIGSGDKTVRLWDVVSRQLKLVLTGHTDTVRGVVFSPDGSTIASAGSSWDETVLRLWDVASGQTKAIFIGRTSAVYSVVFSPDGTTIASGGGDNTVQLWDVASEERKTTLTGHTSWVNSVAFSPDGTTIASGGNDNTVRLWDVASGQTKAILTGHTEEVYSVAFSPDGKTLASGSGGDNTIILWDLTAAATTPATLSISPTSTETLAIGEQLTVSLNIANGENVTGYQATVMFDRDVLVYFSSTNGDYLSEGAFFAAPDVEENHVTLASAAPAGKSDGDGVLATLTFQVVDTKASGLFLSQAHLVDPDGERLFPYVDNGVGTGGTVVDSTVIVHIAEDINGDGVVNVQDLVLVSSNFGKTGENKADINGDGVVDIVDLVKVSAALGNTAAAPSIHPQTLAMLTAADVQGWLTQAQHLSFTDVASQRGIRYLEQLLAVLTPQYTRLLPNYPNPFNPETWIPYHLAGSSDVQIVIYDMRGTPIRRLVLGHQSGGYYTTRSRAAYWDGRNDLGERVATGVYFYQLQADDLSLLRKTVILK